MLELIFYAFALGILAIYLQEIMHGDHIFSFYGRFLERLQFNNRFGFLAKPLGLCTTCFASQIGLWMGLLKYGIAPVFVLFSIAITAISAMIINKVLYEF